MIFRFGGDNKSKCILTNIEGVTIFHITETNFNYLEGIMFEVTMSAQKQIEEFFKDKEIKPIRLFLNSSG
jgi:hypothetical protein